MEKTTKVDLKAFEEMVNKTDRPTHVVQWNGIEITVKHTLSLKEVMTFVDNVVKLCFTPDTGEYLPEVKDFAIKSCILEMYANFDLPQDASRRYELIYSSNIVDCIIGYVHGIQLSEIANAIDTKLANLAQANVEAVHRQMNDLYNAFENLQNQIAGIFSNVSEDDVTKLVEAISGSQFDEAKIVQAYMSQKEQAEESNIIPMPQKSE